jgi:hypothetical protein
MSWVCGEQVVRHVMLVVRSRSVFATCARYHSEKISPRYHVEDSPLPPHKQLTGSQTHSHPIRHIILYSLSLSLSLSFTRSLVFNLSLFRSSTHFHSHSRRVRHIHTHTLSLSLSLAHLLVHSLTHSHSLTFILRFTFPRSIDSCTNIYTLLVATAHTHTAMMPQAATARSTHYTGVQFLRRRTRIQSTVTVSVTVYMLTSMVILCHAVGASALSNGGRHVSSKPPADIRHRHLTSVSLSLLNSLELSLVVPLFQVSLQVSLSFNS